VGLVVAGVVCAGMLDCPPVVLAGLVGVPVAPVVVVELELPQPARASAVSPRTLAVRQEIPRAILSPPTPKRPDPTSLSLDRSRDADAETASPRH